MAGCNCNKEARYDPTKDRGDLKEINLATIKDPLVKFEKSFPFYRMHIGRFLEKVNSYGKDTVEISLLASTFDTPAWKGQFDEG